MKSELKETKSNAVPNFPALYKAIPCGAVVLFTDTHSGVVVKESRSLDVGHFDDCFIICTDSKNWQRLPSGSQVILTQE